MHSILISWKKDNWKKFSKFSFSEIVFISLLFDILDIGNEYSSESEEKLLIIELFKLLLVSYLSFNSFDWLFNW